LESNDFSTKTKHNVSISIPADTYKTGIPQKLRKLFNNYAKLDPKKRQDQEIIKDIMGAPVAAAIAKAFGDKIEMAIVSRSASKNSLPEKANYYSSVNQLPKDEKYDVVILALKPQVAKAGALLQYKNHIKESGIIISLMAGVK
jgi:hypothetical protein